MSPDDFENLVTAINRIGLRDSALIPRNPSYARKLAEIIAEDHDGKIDVGYKGRIDIAGTDLEEVLCNLRDDQPFYFAS